MKIFIDFDRCAFNVEQMYEIAMAESAPEIGTMESLSHFDPDSSGGRLSELLFEDFVEFAQKRKALGDELIIVSSTEGFSRNWDLSYQKAKVEQALTPIRNLFTSIEVTDGSKGAVIASKLKKGERAAYFEDKPGHLNEVKGYLVENGIDINDVQMFQLLRSGERRTAGSVESIEPLPEFIVIKNLMESESKLEVSEENNEE